MRQTRQSAVDEQERELTERANRLVALVALGDQDAFSELYGAQYASIRAIAFSLLKDFHQAEEVAQEALLEIWRLAVRFDPARGSALGWMAQIARTRSIDRIRYCEASKMRDQRHTDHGYRRDFDAVAESVFMHLDVAQLNLGLLELSVLQREAVLLAFFTEKPYAEIALGLGVPLGTLKS